MRPRMSARWAGVCVRRDVTESRTPRAAPISGTTSSGEEMPTSSTKCTRAWVASRASTCAIRVLPMPPGPMIEVSRLLRTEARSRARSASRPSSSSASYRMPGADRLVGREQLAVQPLQRVGRVHAEPVAQVAAVLLVARQRHRHPRDDRPRRAAAPRAARCRHRRRRTPDAGARAPPARARSGPGRARAAAAPSSAVRRARARTSASGPSAVSSSIGGQVQRLPREQRRPRRIAGGELGRPRAAAADRAAARRRPRARSRAGSRCPAGPARRRRTATAPARPAPGAPWSGWPAGPRAHTTSIRLASETPDGDSASAASRAAGRSPGSGVPRQVTSSRRRRAGLTRASLGVRGDRPPHPADIPDGAAGNSGGRRADASAARPQFPRAPGETTAPYFNARGCAAAYTSRRLSTVTSV